MQFFAPSLCPVYFTAMLREDTLYYSPVMYYVWHSSAELKDGKSRRSLITVS